MKIQKLDGRHSGHPVFSHYVVPDERFDFMNLEILHTWRVWCWEHFGPGSERDHAATQLTIKWAWETTRYQRRLYLSKESMTLFMLKWA
jgi:hypothetical protein